MKGYNTDLATALIDNSKNQIFQNCMRDEKKEILRVTNAKNKTFVELGAGHGRIINLLANIAKNVILIDISEKVMPELKKRVKGFINAKVVHGDMCELSESLETEDVQQPVLLLLLNTIGTIEGDETTALNEIKKVFKEKKGEVIITFFRQESLQTWGMDFYTSIEPLIGGMNMGETDFEKGIVVSKQGHISKWSTKEKINAIKKFFGGNVINEIITEEYWIIHIESTD